MARIPEETCERIRYLYNNTSCSMARVAQRFNTSASTVANILNKKGPYSDQPRPRKQIKRLDYSAVRSMLDGSIGKRHPNEALAHRCDSRLKRILREKHGLSKYGAELFLVCIAFLDKNPGENSAEAIKDYLENGWIAPDSHLPKKSKEFSCAV